MQWGPPIGKHEAVAQKIADMAANTFAMEAVAELSAALADAGDYDIRLEAAIAKMYNTERGWRIVDDTLQIRGGRGYETADSLRGRGEAPIPVERAMRDFRINLIFEGSARSCGCSSRARRWTSTSRRAGALVDPEQRAARRRSGAAGPRPLLRRAGTRAAGWAGAAGRATASSARSRAHLRFAERTARKLAPHAVPRHGALRPEARAASSRCSSALVDIGAELFAIAGDRASRARMLARRRRRRRRRAVELADLFCRERAAPHRARASAPVRNDDARSYRVALQVLGGQHAWLEDGIIDAPAEAGQAEGALKEAG